MLAPDVKAVVVPGKAWLLAELPKYTDAVVVMVADGRSVGGGCYSDLAAPVKAKAKAKAKMLVQGPDSFLGPAHVEAASSHQQHNLTISASASFRNPLTEV